MNDHLHHDCKRFEAMITASFDADGLPGDDRAKLAAHVASCASCRESFELASRMEAALVSRRDEVPALDGLLPAFASARSIAPVRAHPTLLGVFRALMSPAGVSIMLVIWATMAALRFRHQIADVFAWTSSDRFHALSQNMSQFLVGVSRGDPYTLTAVYVLLALVVLGSTGAITMRYIRHS